MFHPEFRNLFIQDNEDMLALPYFESQLFISIVVFCGVILVTMTGLVLIFNIFTFAIKVLGEIVNYIWIEFWNSLTPGNQWLEIAAILMTILTFTAALLAIDENLVNVDQTFTKMREDIMIKKERIAELEEELRRLTMEKQENNVIDESNE